MALGRHGSSDSCRGCRGMRDDDDTRAMADARERWRRRDRPFPSVIAKDAARRPTRPSGAPRQPRATPRRLDSRMIESLVEQIESRFGELSRQMTDPEVIGDRQRYAEVGREYRRLEPAAKLAEEWRRSQDDAAGARELLAE